MNDFFDTPRQVDFLYLLAYLIKRDDQFNLYFDSLCKQFKKTDNHLTKRLLHLKKTHKFTLKRILRISRSCSSDMSNAYFNIGVVFGAKLMNILQQEDEETRNAILSEVFPDN